MISPSKRPVGHDPARSAPGVVPAWEISVPPTKRLAAWAVVNKHGQEVCYYSVDRDGENARQAWDRASLSAYHLNGSHSNAKPYEVEPIILDALAAPYAGGANV